MNDNDLIKRSKTLCAIIDLPSEIDEDGYTWILLRDAVGAVENITAEEWAQITKCKDCVFNMTRSSERKGFYQWCDKHKEWREPDWFCSDGYTEEGKTDG